uniref:Ethylene insensitive 2 n=1 Tax=Carica papaya TaxID=3649 RepID=A0A0R5P8Z6_CARPA|nr:ethylene insensitive 2 [Carica papaya]
MEAETLNVNERLGLLHRLRPSLAPVLLIAIGYVDPGKWVATVEGGAHFGIDLVALMLLFNFAAILCQYVSAQISVVTGRDLAQICRDEYDKCTCMFLGIQAELSAITLDLTMVLGIAHALNLLLGVDLSTGVFVAAIDAVLFPIFSTLLENHTANVMCICLAGLILLSYVLGGLLSQPEIPLSMNGILSRLSGESAFALMSLLGANIMPHNFYLHSYIAKMHSSPPCNSKSTLCHDHFFSILCVFSGIYLVNYVLMNAAANVFDSTGLVLLTFQDAMSLMEQQVFRSPLAWVAFLLVLFFSNQISALTWNISGQVVLHDFLKLDIPNWLHRATIRIIAIVPALYCVWTSGAEGIYQLLIFTQVMVALMLPSSVIPLFRIASSRPIMGVHKISQFLEFLALVTFMGMLGLNIIFVVEMIFGSSDWVGNLRWNTGNSTSIPYIALLITSCASFCLMLWLAATPLKSATNRLDAQAWNLDIPSNVTDSSIQREEIEFMETRHHKEELIQMQEPSVGLGGSVEIQSDTSVANFGLDLPENIMGSDREIHLTTVEENNSPITFPCPSVNHHEELESKSEPLLVLPIINNVTDDDLMETKTVKVDMTNPVEKTVGVEGDIRTEKDDDEGDTWEPEEPLKAIPASSLSLSSDGPSSLRSLSGKSDDAGNSAGSLSRLAGLGRAARRHFAAVLDDFWGLLFDFHGHATAEAKAKKLDTLLGLDLKLASSLKVDTTSVKEFSGYFPSVGGRGSESLVNQSIYESMKQQRVQGNLDSSFGVQRGSSSLWPSNHMHLLDAYVQSSIRNVQDSGEKRYSSLRSVPTSEGWDNQPATVHGYQIASYLSRIAKDKSSDGWYGQMDSQASKLSTLGTTNYRDQLAFALGQKLHNGISSMSAARASGFQNLVVSRNSPLQSERSYCDVRGTGPGDNVGIPANTKKYHSLPDISGLSIPLRDLYTSDQSSQLEGSVGYGSSVGRANNYETSVYSNSGSRAGAPLAFDELSPSKGYRDAFALPMSSSSDTLWSRQPFEQFGVADTNRNVGSEGHGNKANLVTREFTSAVDSEAKLLQSFRHCIMKLLKLEGSDWLFKQNDGADEDLIDRVAARERFIYEVETRDANQVGHTGEPLVSSVPHCGEGCVWKADLIVSFGVWCIHRILDLSLMESRPELWGKYTYVLNRLQGVIDLAFSMPRTPMLPCFCLQIPAAHQHRSSPPISNGMLPPASKPGKGKCTTSAMLLDMIKDVEIAISCRKGRSGTAAGDVAFPKGKENLASVLKRYKRRLSNKPVGVVHEGSGSRKVSASATPYGL